MAKWVIWWWVTCGTHADVGYLTKLGSFFRRCIGSMEYHTPYPNPHTGLGFPTPPVQSDPIVGSSRLSLPFPCEAAATLGDKRCEHGKIDEVAVAQAQQRIYMMASMMGVWNLHDDPPTAA